MILGPARERLTPTQFRQFERDGSLVLSQRHARPRYFDGRFLDARSLTQDQTYILTRQALQGRAFGAGVVSGLDVSAESATTLRITAGQGVAPTGEIVVLDRDLDLDLTDVSSVQQLDAAFGLRRVPGDPPRARSGLFVLALRAVEYTANPIASFPTTAGGDRTVQDGDVIEATALTLVPYPEQGGEVDLDRRRGLVAREIFVEGVRKGIPANALPIAMLALQSGSVVWTDADMVQRAIGAETLFPGFGLAPRALREAHFAQYERHLSDVLTTRQNLNRGLRFSAAEHFSALPPGGRLPVAAIDDNEFSQIYFPPELDVQLSITAADEIPGLLEDSLLLPPIDLLASRESLESTAVLIMIPVPRAQFEELVRGGRLLRIVRPLKAAIPGVVSQRRPIEALQLLRTRPSLTDDDAGGQAADAVWRDALAQTGSLWFVRRRDVPYRLEIATLPVVGTPPEPEPGPEPGDGPIISDELRARLRELELETRFEESLRSGGAEISRAAVALVSQPVVLENRLLLAGVASELSAAGALSPDRLGTLRERYGRQDLGSGIRRLAGSVPELVSDAGLILPLARAGVVADIDRLAAAAEGQNVEEFARSLSRAASTNDIAAIRELVEEFESVRPEPNSDLVARVEDRMRELGQLTRFRTVSASASAPAATEMILRTLLVPTVFDNPLLVESVLAQMGDSPLGLLEIRNIARAHTAASVGTGLQRLAEAQPGFFTNRTVARTLGRSSSILALDSRARTLQGAQFNAFANRLFQAARTGDVNQVRDLAQ